MTAATSAGIAGLKQDSRPLNDILFDLRSKSDAVREAAADELYNYILASSRSLSAEAFNRVYNEIHARCFALVNSADLQDKLAGVTAIDKIVDVLGNDMSRAMRLAASVQRAFPCPDPLVMTIAANIFAKLAAQGGTLMAGHVDVQVKSCIEWLQGERIEPRRYAAVLILRALSRTAPFLIVDYVNDLLDNLWTALRDPTVAIREAAAGALSRCLIIARSRDATSASFAMVYDQAQRGFKLGSADAIHGSLLAYKELVLEASTFMNDRFAQVCDQVLHYKDHRDPLVRQAVIGLLPTLATYNPDEFNSHYLHKTMVYLLSQLKRERERPSAFKAIGYLSDTTKVLMNAYLEPILASIRDSLQPKARKSAATDEAIFQCISMLAHSVGPALTKHMHELLDLMFGHGLSESLNAALMQLGHDIPPLLPEIQDRTLNLISMTLSGKPFRPAGAPSNNFTNGAVTNGHDSHIPRDQHSVRLALEVLGSFNFKGAHQASKDAGLDINEQSLGEFIRDRVVPYLESDSGEIRKAAALSCCRVLANDPVVLEKNSHSVQLVNEVLQKLLTLAVADPNPTIRELTIMNLDPTFDKHLAQAESVRSLFIAMHDEMYVIRELAIKIIGRLAPINPAFVMPSLRKTLIALLTELEYSTASRNKEEAATLIGLLVGTSQRLTVPYVKPMLNVLLPKARDPSTPVATAILTVLGELARVGGQEVLIKQKELMDIILDTLHDQAASPKRYAALHALGELASHSGYVIEPYIDHPTLLATLVTLLKIEPSPPTRREIIRVLGVLGALDPYRHSITEGATTDSAVEVFNPTDPSHPSNIGPAHDEYYPTVAFHALLVVFTDPSLSDHHTAVVDAIMYIFRSLRLKVVNFLPQVLPAFLQVMRTCPVGLQEYYFQNLGQLISMVKQHIRNHLPPIMATIRDFWTTTTNPGLQVIIIDVIQSIALALDAEFKAYLPSLLPLLLQAFDQDLEQPRRQSSLIRVLYAFSVFGASLEEYLHLMLPAIVSLFEMADVPVNVKRQAMLTISQLSHKINFADHASRIIHPLARVLSSPSTPSELRIPIMDVFCSLLVQMGSEFALFVPTINKALVKNRISYTPYDGLVVRLLKGEAIPQDQFFGEPAILPNNESTVAADAGLGKLPVNQGNLKMAWDVPERAKPDDWRDWMKRLSVQLLKSSPSLSLRACANLAEVYTPIARELFNAAFVSCWTELYDQYQEELVRAISTALASSTMPPEITQQLLNLAEFMEHDDKILPISIATLGGYALKCRAYAKALHYKELEVLSDPNSTTIEELIRINNSLQQPDVSVGILIHAHQVHNLELKEEWYLELERWEDALAAFDRRRGQGPESFDVTLGRMRCLHALGEWESLAQLAQDIWPRCSQDLRRKMAPLAAAASWGLAQWESMDLYTSVLKHDSPDRAWFKAIVTIHRGTFNKAQSHINKARDLLDTELTTLVGESYNRAYDAVVRIQMLSELEEIISYKKAQNAGNYERTALIQQTWMTRLKGCKRDVDVWQRVLKVRALVLTPRENLEMWVKFANLCRKSGRLGLAEKTLNSLLMEDKDEESKTEELQTMTGPPQVIYAHLKYLWATGAKEETLAFMREFTSKLSRDLGLHPEGQQEASNELVSSGRVAECIHLLARCYYKLGEWQSALQEDWGSEATADILQSYLLATNLDSTWYKAWHAWALANSEVVTHFAKSQADPDAIPPQVYTDHLVPSVQAFFRSIALSTGNSLQDTLRLLTLWFKYGHSQEVTGAIMDGIRSVSVDTWLEVIPQLIARIHAPSANVRKLVRHVLTDVGRAHPQALVYPLTVASKYPSASRRVAAMSIMEKMRDHSAELVDQALLVSSELIRVAILWHELWHEGLEEASRLFYGDHNIDAMFATLEPLHELVERGPETLREISFAQTFGRDLAEARESCRRYQQYGEIADLNHAWDMYYQVFRKINKSLPSLTLLELQYVSPKLLNVKDLELAIPGTYQAGKKIVRISSFGPTSEVFTSKQRPRKLRIVGSDGRDYNFLLKGHEDLRQDERVMQLFGLVNTLLQKDAETFKRHLTIVKYPVIPLSPNSGLLGWVDSTDTLHVLIKNYRDSRKILLNIEHRLILQMAPDFDHLCLMQKLEVFEYSLDNTTGQDFYRVLWLRSRNSEAWLDRRSNYCRTLAVMSMVGHILGLGDRHPSNLLMDRVTGRIVHVDFGDCFEVAMQREKHPEKVPFRLTRMLTSAMEVSGIEGTFKITCENTMRVLRENKESIIAVLEAFVHDPLINWRLVHGGRQVGSAAGGDMSTARRPRGDEANVDDGEAIDQINTRALQVVERVQQKLTGRDFKPTIVLDVNQQVKKLIEQATSLENLSQCFIGWCPFW